jgi:hypothetical protein
MSKILQFGNTTERRDGGLSQTPIKTPEKILVPKASLDETKLDFITLPLNGQLILGRAELLKKADCRISKDGHLVLLHCSGNGSVAVYGPQQVQAGDHVAQS